MGGMFSLESSFFDVTVKTANVSPVSNLTKPDILKKDECKVVSILVKRDRRIWLNRKDTHV
jgi:hypothetical protein